jgi:hypothetical protein
MAIPYKPVIGERATSQFDRLRASAQSDYSDFDLRLHFCIRFMYYEKVSRVSLSAPVLPLVFDKPGWE